MTTAAAGNTVLAAFRQMHVAVLLARRLQDATSVEQLRRWQGRLNQTPAVAAAVLAALDGWRARLQTNGRGGSVVGPLPALPELSAVATDPATRPATG